jgi:hypothetical protein
MLLHLLNLCCAFAIVCTSMACYTFNCTFVNSCFSYITTFSSLVSFYTVYASTRWCSSTLSSFNSSMHIGSINVALGHVCSLTCQRCLFLCKTSTIDVPVVFMSWIIICANYIFTLYTFFFAHSKDDDECGGDHIVNNWIFNTPFFVLLNSFFTFVFFNNFISSSSLCLCSLFCASFSLAIRYSFSITLSAFKLLWIPKLQKCAQLLATNTNYPIFSCPWTSHPSNSFFHLHAIF